MIGINSFLNLWWNSPLKPSGPGLLFVGRSLITGVILLLVIDLFQFPISSWFGLRRVMFLRIYSFLLGCPAYWHIIFYTNLLQSSVFLWSHSFISDFTYFSTFFFSWLVWLKVYRFCLSSQRTSSWFHWLIFSIFSFLFHLFLLWFSLFLYFY